MDDVKYERIAEVMGRGHADVIQGMLQAEGIPAELIQDSLSQSSYVMPLAVVQILVPKADAHRARELIRGLDGVAETEEDE